MKGPTRAQNGRIENKNGHWQTKGVNGLGSTGLKNTFIEGQTRGQTAGSWSESHNGRTKKYNKHAWLVRAALGRTQKAGGCSSVQKTAVCDLGKCSGLYMFISFVRHYRILCFLSKQKETKNIPRTSTKGPC